MTDTGQSEPRWRKSTRSGPGDCVEVAFVDETVLVRDSKNPAGPVLRFGVESWKEFLNGVPELPQGD